MLYTNDYKNYRKTALIVIKFIVHIKVYLIKGCIIKITFNLSYP